MAFAGMKRIWSHHCLGCSVPAIPVLKKDAVLFLYFENSATWTVMISTNTAHTPTTNTLLFFMTVF